MQPATPGHICQPVSQIDFLKRDEGGSLGAPCMPAFRRPETLRYGLVDRLGFVLIVTLLQAFSLLPYGLVARLGNVLGAGFYSFPSLRKHVVLLTSPFCFRSIDRLKWTIAMHPH